MSQRFRRNSLFRVLPAPVMFVLFIGLALLVDPVWAVYSWALIFVCGRIVDWAFPLGSVLPDSGG